MSHKYPTEHELGQLKRFCRCGAEPGEWCRTSKGNATVYLHVYR